MSAGRLGHEFFVRRRSQKLSTPARFLACWLGIAPPFKSLTKSNKLLLVGAEGLEPSRDCSRTHLKRMRLPIPPRAHVYYLVLLVFLLSIFKHNFIYLVTIMLVRSILYTFYKNHGTIFHIFTYLRFKWFFKITI